MPGSRENRNYGTLRKYMTKRISSNSLGDLRAEADIWMLGRAFLETAEYRTLIETSDRLLIVGRRGTGKSALTQALEHYWRPARGESAS
jgi:hypothetical protein